MVWVEPWKREWDPREASYQCERCASEIGHEREGWRAAQGV